MKRILLLCACFFIAGLINAQTVKTGGETAELKDLTGSYCTVHFIASKMGNTVTIQTDSDTGDFVDQEGKKVKFKTETQLLNFMDAAGWTVKLAYVAYATDTEVFIFERKKDPQDAG